LQGTKGVFLGETRMTLHVRPEDGLEKDFRYEKSLFMRRKAFPKQKIMCLGAVLSCPGKAGF
jgi:hypothetical protein